VNAAQTVCAVIAAKAGRDPAAIGPETRLDSLGLDSMALVEALFEIEEACGVVVPFNANRPGEARIDLATVGGIARGVERLLAERV